MHTIHEKVTLYSIALVLLIGLTACGSNATPSEAVQLTDKQVRRIVNDMLDGYNEVDYGAFSKDLTPTMKLEMDEKLFKDFYDKSVDTLGWFQSVTSAKQVNSDNSSTTWLITAKFQHSTEFFHVIFDNASGQIEDMDFGPGN